VRVPFPYLLLYEAILFKTWIGLPRAILASSHLSFLPLSRPFPRAFNIPFKSLYTVLSLCELWRSRKILPSFNHRPPLSVFSSPTSGLLRGSTLSLFQIVAWLFFCRFFLIFRISLLVSPRAQFCKVLLSSGSFSFPPVLITADFGS